MNVAQPPHPTLIPLPEELGSERVVLRPLRADDAEAMFAAIDEAREHLAPWMAWVHHHRTVDDTRDYCIRSAANWLLRRNLAVGIFDAPTGAFLGGSGFLPPNWEVRSFEIGYWIRPSAEGNGFVGETVRLLARFAFAALAARRLEIRCDATNQRSRRVAERAGFVYEGTLRNDDLGADGQPRDTLVFALVPEDFARLAASGWVIK